MTWHEVNYAQNYKICICHCITFKYFYLLHVIFNIGYF
jgi:hypothetical protein